MSKRSSPLDPDAGARENSPNTKRPRLVTFEPVRLPAISTVTDLDKETLAFQNKKLGQRLEHRRRIEHELRNRIDKFEQRQLRDDVFLCIINRHWNRLDEDVRILLQRFDAETTVETEVENESEATASFLIQLSQWDKEELDRELAQRVEFSKRDISKLVQAFDRLLQRNEKITKLLQNNDVSSPKSTSNEQIRAKSNSLDSADDARQRENVDDVHSQPKIDDELVKRNAELQSENQRLQTLASRIQEKNHTLSMKYSAMKDRLTAAETKVDELKKELEETEFQLEKTHMHSDKLEYRLCDAIKKVNQLELQQQSTDVTSSASIRDVLSIKSEPNDGSGGADDDATTNVSRNKLLEMNASFEEQRELAANRLSELQELMDKYRKALQTIEQLKIEILHVPEELILNSADYRRVQSQFSVLYNESLQIRSQLDDARNQMILTKTAHLKQIEQMESEELLAQKQLRGEMVQLEDQLSQVRREYEMLRVEFEQNLAANEQSGPLNKEMRQLLTSYKVQNGQFRAEVQRFKRKWKEAVSTIAKVQKELDHERKMKENSIFISLSAPFSFPLSSTTTTTTSDSQKDDKEVSEAEKAKEIVNDLEKSGELNSSDEEGQEQIGEHDCDVEAVKELKQKLKRAEKKYAELQISLDAFKSLSNEEQEKAEHLKQIMTENNKLRIYISNLVKKKGKDCLPTVQDEPSKHSKRIEEQLEKLKKEVAACKQEEETLLNEMEVTGQAFEEMQEQNVRLVQQLKEKDDANFKLMSERIRTNQQHKLLREEKELLQDQVTALQNQVEAQNLVVRKLEEKERLLHQQVTMTEKEIGSRQQAFELHKRKAVECAQSAADFKLQMEKLTAQLYEAQQAVATKTAGLEDESFKIVRLQEEISSMRKRLERAKKMEKASTSDEVLLEEIRELKEQLTCPSCKVHRKDAVLTKCYHVFCMDCMKTRYETRQRKCPKCNAAFGANDFKRIYIG